MARRILALTSIWNFSVIAAFSVGGSLVRSANNSKICSLIRRENTARFRVMSSTASSSPLPSDEEPIVRRSPRKKGSSNGSASSSDDSIGLLERWIQHDHHSYHADFLSPTQAYKIRIALVEWYRGNRRKLPWRGDAGPYDGSTAGYGAASNNSGGKKSNGKKRKDEGKDIRSFFAASSSNKKKKTDAVAGAASSGKQSTVKKKGAKSDDGNETTSTDAPREVTAYGVWVSEIMLQQTRVEAVVPYWIKWMNSFPTVHDLANATDEEVNSHWAGLGFYRRARLLHSGAKRVVNDYGGIVPNTVEELLKIEGIGRYTASAVASIAYGVEVPVVDGNVCRVLSRLTGVANNIKAGVLKDDLGWELAERIIQAKSSTGNRKKMSESYETIGSPGEVNQALMELGATYCSPAGSGIDESDPLKQFYVSTQLGVAVGQATRHSNASVRDRVERLITEKSSLAGENESKCRLCDPSGVSTAYYDITDRITADLSSDSKTKPSDLYSIAGHSSLPIPPPKKSKREEVIAVAVISSHTSDEEKCWLMVKRPSDGLLAGQWEFPSVEVWNSAKDGTSKKGEEKKKAKSDAVEVPVIDPAVRSKALDSFLSDILPGAKVGKRSQVTDAPVVHVFSHVCHTMWIEHGQFSDKKTTAKRWKVNGQEVGWFTDGDMASVGITSGVRKVLGKTQQSE